MSMKPIVISTLTGLTALLSATSSASAQGYGNGHGGYAHAPKAHVCYEKFSTPDVYGIVRKPVVKTEGRWEIKQIAAVYGEAHRKVLVQEGRWEVKSEPAVYENRERKVLVAPAKEIVHVTPPVFRIEKTKHKVHDDYGHEHYVTKARRIQEQPAKQSVEKTEAVYKTETVKVLVKPAHHTRIWHPPVYDYVEQKVLFRKGQTYARPVYKAHGEAC